MKEQKVIEAYADGSQLTLIAESFNISETQVIEILRNFKEKSRYKKTFTDEFKKVISERDINGIARRTIGEELGINASTVKKACEKFGQAIKEKATSDQAYTRIDGEFDLKVCPSCGSNKNNLVDDSTTFCMSCDSEHEYYFGEKDEDDEWVENPYVLKINFEYIEE